MTIETGKNIVSQLNTTSKQWPQWLATFLSTLMLFCTGICFSWSSPSLSIMQSTGIPFHVTNDEAAWIASLLPFGSAIGPIVGAGIARVLGPKQSILTASIPFLVGYILIAFASDATYLFASRLISGIGVGISFSSVPIYIGEIAENHNRGSLMILFTAMLSLGGLFVTSLGPYISIKLMAMLSAILPLLFLMSFSLIPDSPYFLMRIGKDKEAYESLKWFRRQKLDADVDTEMNLIKKTVEDNLPFIECFKQISIKPNPKALGIVIFIIIAQQFSGIMAVIFYQEQIYASADIPLKPEVAVIISTVISNISGLSSILFIDRWGRKPLLILSSIGCASSTLLIGIYYHVISLYGPSPQLSWLPIIALNLFFISFSIGLGPIPYTILGELFSSSYKEIANCLVSVLGALIATAITKIFQVVSDSLGSSVSFFGFSVLLFFSVIIFFIVIPETMHKSLLEIQNMLRGVKATPTPTGETTKENTRF